MVCRGSAKNESRSILKLEKMIDIHTRMGFVHETLGLGEENGNPLFVGHASRNY